MNKLPTSITIIISGILIVLNTPEWKYFLFVALLLELISIYKKEN